MHRTILAGMLALGTALQAQEFPKVQPKSPRTRPTVVLRTSPKTLEEVLAGVTTPEQAQQWVSDNIEYVRRSGFVYGDNGADHYNSVQAILDKKAGNCKEGFVLTSALLKRLGYDVAGLALMPEQGDGHIITIYRDRKTSKVGTAGISNADFTPPRYDNFRDIAADMALQHLWTTANVAIVPFQDPLYKQSQRIPQENIGSVNLEQQFGVRFDKKKIDYGEYHREFLLDGYRLSLDNALIPMKEPLAATTKTITNIRATHYDTEGKWQVNIEYVETLTRHGQITVFFDDELRPNSIIVHKSDPLRVNGDVKVFGVQSLRFRLAAGEKLDITAQELDSYIRLGQSSLELLEYKDAVTARGKKK